MVESGVPLSSSPKAVSWVDQAILPSLATNFVPLFARGYGMNSAFILFSDLILVYQLRIEVTCLMVATTSWANLVDRSLIRVLVSTRRGLDARTMFPDSC